MSDSEDDYMSDVSSESESGSDFEDSPKKKKAAPKKPTAAGGKKKAAAKKKVTSESEDDDTPKKKKAAPKKPTTAGGKKKAAAKKKVNSESESEGGGNSDKSDDDDSNVFKNISAEVKKGKTIEEIYQKKELLDQILLRPDTYIGSTEKQEEELWVWEDDRMVRRKVSFVPGIYKIFDEILVNAADNKQRGTMKFIKVVIDPEAGFISVTNDGVGIPIQIHKEHNIYIPELIFGNLLTSSHYDDSEKRLTGGRNGFGAKLANIFSTKFMVECADSKAKKLYKQTFTNNMRTKEEPKITPYTNKTDYTKITFYPELDRFGMVEFDADLIALLSKRVYDIAGCNPTLKVTLNDKDLGIKSFEKYISLYFPDEEEAPKVYYEKVSDRWEVAVTLSTEGQFNQVSFVNSICTVKGGTHVTHALANVVTAIQDQVNKKNKGTDVKPAFIKNHLSVFVNCLVENPHFDSQTKETLTSKVSSFGSRCEPSNNFIKKVLDSKSGIVASILAFAQFKDQTALKRSTASAGRKGKITHPKLDDANLAGSNKSEDCTLILTEGDSAKSLAVAGISVVGKDHYGCFPLKGKLLNVREQSTKVINNDEINNITMILGLQYGKVYENLSTLRYGHLMIMTDQDHDGSHIKGLIINMVHHFWPTLLKMPGFLVEFITPIVKVFKTGQKPISFYTLPEFLEWRANNNGKGWEIKYYKGLGTSKPSEGKEYFSDLERHKIDFEWDEGANDAIELAFAKARADDRKKWMAEHVEGTFLEQYGVKKLSYSDFINKELVLFSIADCERSIPNIVDGMKTSLRKTLFSCFKRNLKKEIKVAQLIGYVSEHSAYHHGEASLYSTIVGMAQEFVGSNNINLLYPAGSYGTRIAGGKDCSSARYIHTRLNEIARAVYHQDDDSILSIVVDDGKKVQPKFYMPIIPMILVNGSVGIGTGWSSTIPNYNPRDLIQNMRLAIDGKPMLPIKPWYRGFLGDIVANEASKVQGSQYISRGVWKKLSDYQFEITELPIGMWTQEYREFLDELETPGTKKKKKEEKEKKGRGGKGTKATSKTTTKRGKAKSTGDDDDEGGNEKVVEPVVKSYTNYCTEATIHFIINTVNPVDEIKIEKVFKLTTNLNESNMVVFDEEGRIQRFATTMAIQEHFFKLRMVYYQKRKDFLAERLSEEFTRLSNKARFILAVVNKELIISNVKKVDLMKKLKEMKFDRISNKRSDKSVKEKLKKKKGNFDEEDAALSSDEEDEEQDGENDAAGEEGTSGSGKKSSKTDDDEDTRGYDYLLSLPLWSLTLERVKKIIDERDAKKKEWDILLSTPLNDIYRKDLDVLEIALDNQDEYDEQLRQQTNNLKKKTKTKALPRAKKISAKTLKDTKEAALSKLVKPTVAKPTSTTTPTTATTSTSKTATESTVGKRKKSEDVTTTPPTRTMDSYLVQKPSPPSESSSVLPQPKKSTLVSLDSDDDDDDDFGISKPISKPSPTISSTTGKKAAATRKTPTVELSESEDDAAGSDDDASGSEFESPPPKKLRGAASSKKAAAKPVSKKAAATSKKAAAKPKPPKDDSFIAEEEESDDEPVVLSRPTRSTRSTAPTKINLPFLDSDSDDDLFDDEHSESD